MSLERRWTGQVESGKTRRGVGLVVAALAAVVAGLAWGGDPSGEVAHGAAPAGEGQSQPVTAATLEKRFKGEIQPLLTKFCFDCHGDGATKGDVNFDQYTSLTSVQSARQFWSHVIDVLNQDLMPPEKKPQPTPEQVGRITGWINDALSFCDCTGPRDPGRVTIRRLNRTEYNNTVRDLVGVSDFRPADDFPADDTGYGFDNIADVLSMSPLLAEKYLAAAEQVLEKAIVTENPYARAKKRYAGGALQARGEGNSGGDLTKNGSTTARHGFPCDGQYEVRIRASQDKFGDEPAKMAVRLNRNEVGSFDVHAVRGKPQVFTLKLDVKAGEQRVTAAYVNNKVDNDNPDRSKRGDRNLYVEFIEIDGPLNPPPPPLTEAHKRIFSLPPDQEKKDLSEGERARLVVERFATRAFRRPVAREELDGLMKLYRLARTEGDSYEEGVRLALTGVLVSPHFLFRIELDPPKYGTEPHAITEYELATRLSYFLWSTMPDDQLFELAKAGRLRERDVLRGQVKRMLADPKASAFVQNFIGQWLETRNLASYTPDPKKYPGFDDALRTAMRKEAELFFQALVSEDRSVLELLDADWTLVNERLAKFYGIEGVKGDDFRKVKLSPDKGRGGVLTMAGVLTVTAMPTRTSPVKRGKFVLEKMLNAPPPPPPPDVPELTDKPGADESASLRERLEAHRADPNCAVCHIRMDAIGFSLENFDAIGRWRDKDEAGRAIDPAGKLPEGETLASPGDLKKVLMGRKDQFVNCLVEKMLTYALGRGMKHYDRCTVKDIAESLKKDDYKVSALVTAIVESDAFQKRRAKKPGE